MQFKVIYSLLYVYLVYEGIHLNCLTFCLANVKCITHASAYCFVPHNFLYLPMLFTTIPRSVPL